MSAECPAIRKLESGIFDGRRLIESLNLDKLPCVT